jgi:exopolyphosphatase / guanosine-5'-triphosphate,3'-diphosphate pyrophosphatase
MRIAVVDVGSNTVRLLVAAAGRSGVDPVREEKAVLLLGEEVERHGRIRPRKLDEVSDCVERYARVARELGAGRIEILVTAPGRQSENAEELVHRIALATGSPTRVVSADEEGRLAWFGAVEGADGELPETVAVCDVGGGSTELVVGTRSGGPAWSASVDLGCVRLTERFLADDPPRKAAVVRAAREAERHFEGVLPPIPQVAFAAGGTARALRKFVGPTLGARELEIAARCAAKRPSRELAEKYGIDRSRARTLAAGAVLLRSVERRISVPFVVARTGLREGAVLELLAEQQAA